MARRKTGQARKVRVPGTNRWVTEAELVRMQAARAGAEAEADAFDESGWEAESPLGPRPEPPPAPPPAEDRPHYYHAYLPHLRVRRGRKDALRWRGGVIYPTSAEQEARVRKALVKYVPGGDPDRWKGDTPGLERDLRCPECAYFTRNFNVWTDHGRKTGHFPVE